MNIIKKIILGNKVLKTYKAIKELADGKAELAKEVKKVLDNLKADFDALLALVPALKELYMDVKNVLGK